MMILGHWRKQKTPKAPGNIGENIEENHGNRGKQDKRQQDPGTQVVLEISSLLLLPERACAQKGGVGTGGNSLGKHEICAPFIYTIYPYPGLD